MARTSCNQYLQQVEDSILSKDGYQWAELVSYRHPHVANPKLQLEDSSSICQRHFDPPLDDMVACHLRGVWAVSNNDYVEAYIAQTSVVQNFIKVFQSQKDENWALPVLYNVCLDLRLFAMNRLKGVWTNFTDGVSAKNADKQLVKSGKGKPGEKVEKAAEHLMGCFRVCVSDTYPMIFEGDPYCTEGGLSWKYQRNGGCWE